jgi:alkanesulfonate monooxygenase SsuD/methylene tetrahydromethanopterin reductase-like flavin-dependent oxidoreductase (luciferase family)
VAAEFGDGWFPAFVARDRLPDWTTRLSRLRAAAAPRAQALTTAAGPIAVAGADAGASRDAVATCVAWYLSAMGDVYRQALSGQGYAAEVEAILAANPRPSPRHGTVPPAAEGILDQLTAYGTGDQVRQQLKAWDQIADIATLLLPPGLPWPSIEATLLAAAPDRAFRGSERVGAGGPGVA